MNRPWYDILSPIAPPAPAAAPVEPRELDADERATLEAHADAERRLWLSQRAGPDI